MRETITATRVTMLMDEDTRIYLSKASEYTEGGEFWEWEHVEDVQVELVYCDDCGTIVSEDRDNVSGNPDKCADCDSCEICAGYLGELNHLRSLEVPRSVNPNLCIKCYSEERIDVGL